MCGGAGNDNETELSEEIHLVKFLKIFMRVSGVQVWVDDCGLVSCHIMSPILLRPKVDSQSTVGIYCTIRAIVPYVEEWPF